METMHSMEERIVPRLAEPEVAGTTSPRPFVGRAQELVDLAAQLEEAGSGRGSLVLLTGEPGIGKTRLMAELGRQAGRRGVRVVGGRCWEEGGAPPFWPWIQVLRSLGDDLERLAALGDARQGGAAHVMPEGDRIRLFDAVGRLLVRASAEQPLLVALDDVHAADVPSLLLLRFLGDALADARILLLASYRDAEPRVRELADVFAELARAGNRVSLRGLTATEIEAYVTAIGGGRPRRELVARLHEVTAGNPFFVGELVRMLAGEAHTDLDGALKDPSLRIPEEVRVLIRRRLATLTPEAVVVLRVAAVIGREFDLRLLRQI